MTVAISSTNFYRRKLVRGLISLSRKLDMKVLKRVAQELAKPRRRRVAVNVSKLNRYASESEIAIVPGKVLSSGALKKKLTVIAESFSTRAFEKIKSAGGRPILLSELLENESLQEELKSKPKRLIK